jgi:hypothetical protein
VTVLESGEEIRKHGTVKEVPKTVGVDVCCSDLAIIIITRRRIHTMETLSVLAVVVLRETSLGKEFHDFLGLFHSGKHFMHLFSYVLFC